MTSCYIINLCSLCGVNDTRGVCYPSTGLTQCRCFPNDKDPLRPYTGDRCLEAKPRSPNPVSWAPVIIGIVTGLAGLFAAITCCLWVVALYRRRLRKPTK